jgi:RNA polymerase sigma factor (sigma-70 family)
VAIGFTVPRLVAEVAESWRFAHPAVEWIESLLVTVCSSFLSANPMMNSQTSQPSNAQFPTTHWSQVVAARAPAEPEARAALAELCGRYWYPLYAFIRRRGHDPASAEDLVQGFFTALLEKDGLSSVDRSKGRFRSFLVAACGHFISNRRDHDRALKRGRGRVFVPIDTLNAEDHYQREPIHELTAERLFERRWATTLLDHVLERLGAEVSAAGKGCLFKALRPALLGSVEKVPYVRIAAELGCSESAARLAAHRLRARYRALLRQEVARTVADPDAVDDEIRDLFTAFAG